MSRKPARRVFALVRRVFALVRITPGRAEPRARGARDYANGAGVSEDRLVATSGTKTHTRPGSLSDPVDTEWQKLRGGFSERFESVGSGKNEHLQERQVGEGDKIERGENEKPPSTRNLVAPRRGVAAFSTYQS
jgi:hypothetical protein